MFDILQMRVSREFCLSVSCYLLPFFVGGYSWGFPLCFPFPSKTTHSKTIP